MSAHLSLYHFDGCPYCGRVRDAIQRLGATIELRDIRRSSDHREALVAATGRQTVPCLRIGDADAGEDRWMHESADIIRFLEQTFA